MSHYTDKQLGIHLGNILDFVPLSVGTPARWVTYEGGEEFAEILDRNGNVIARAEAWTKTEAIGWVLDWLAEHR